MNLDVHDLATAASAMNVARKTDVVADCPIDENDDIQPAIELWKDGDRLAIVFCPDVDRDQALRIISMAVPMMRLDAIVVSMDVHYTHSPTNPDGEPWKPGEMQHRCDNEGLCEVGFITDAIATMAYLRDGTNRMVTEPYHINKTAREVHWKADPNAELYRNESTAANVGGLVHDVIMGSFGQTVLIPGTLAEKLSAMVTATGQFGYLTMLTTANETLRTEVTDRLSKVPGVVIEDITP